MCIKGLEGKNIFIIFVKKHRKKKKDIYYYTLFQYINRNFPNPADKNEFNDSKLKSLDTQGFTPTNGMS